MPATMMLELTGSGDEMATSKESSRGPQTSTAGKTAGKVANSASGSYRGPQTSTAGKVANDTKTPAHGGRKEVSNGRPRDQKTGASPGRAIPDKSVRDNWNRATLAQKRDYITAKAIDLGAPPAIAAGFAGNFFSESTFRPGAINPGDSTSGTDSIHLGQWNDARAKELISRYGKNPSVDQQIKFGLDEINGKAGDIQSRQVMKDYNSNPNMTAREAAKSIFDNFERGSAKTRLDSMKTRQDVADQAYRALGNESNAPPIGAITKPGVNETIKNVPANIPFVKAFADAGKIVRGFIKGDKTNTVEVVQTATLAGTDLSTVLAGPFGGLAAGFIKEKIDSEFLKAMPSQQTINKAKVWAGFAGGLIGGPVGLALGVAGASAIDAAGNPVLSPGVSKPAPRVGGGGNSTMLFLNEQIPSPSVSLQGLPNADFSKQRASRNVIDQTKTAKNKSLYDALFDPSYNPLNSEYWNSAAWNFGLVILALSLVAFGAYSMVSKSLSTDVQIVGAS